ncbi:hypothetical protein MXB_4641 [Myxobolus squamalis]|nr:hypothetical protein MXB_4641 [Myxobolus squamalis]
MNIIINHPTMSGFNKDFTSFVRKNIARLKYITPLGEFNAGVYGNSSYHDNKLSYFTKKYVLIMSKYFMIDHISLLIKLVKILESTDASIVGGKYGGQAINQCDSFGIFYTSINHNKTILIQSNGKAHEAITGFENCYKVDTMKNFFVAKLSSLLIGEAINYIDHEYANDDFFLRQIYLGRKVVWCGDIILYQKEYSSVKFDHNHPKSKAWISDHGFDEIVVN